MEQAKTDKTVLRIDSVKVNYGHVQALKGISLEVKEGSIVALLGANGAGKTTTLKAISALAHVAAGKIFLNGEDITNIAAEKVVAKGVIQSPEGRQTFPELTVEENLMIGAFTVKDKKAAKANLEIVFGYFERLLERRKQVAATLSGGEQQMLAIGRALMASPKVLLLDEPSLGLAPLIVRDIFHIIKTLNERGTTILIVEQNAMQTLKIASYAYVLEVGNIIHHGTAEEIMRDERLMRAYLGREN